MSTATNKKVSPTDDVRTTVATHFAQLLDYHELRRKHLELIVEYVTKLPDNDVALAWLAKCKDLRCECCNELTLPDTELVYNNGKKLEFSPYLLRTIYGLGEPCRTLEDFEEWFSRWVDEVRTERNGDCFCTCDATDDEDEE